MLRVKIFITNTKTRKEYKLREEMLRVTPLTKRLLKNLLTSLYMQAQINKLNTEVSCFGFFFLN